MTWRGKYVGDLSAEELREVPDALLCGMLRFNCRDGRSHHAAVLAQQRIVIDEARRRGIKSWSLEMLDPSPCHCGKRGLYIVGKVTYCREHVGEATAARRAIREDLEKRAREREREWKVSNRRYTSRRRNVMVKK